MTQLNFTHKPDRIKALNDIAGKLQDRIMGLSPSADIDKLSILVGTHMQVLGQIEYISQISQQHPEAKDNADLPYPTPTQGEKGIVLTDEVKELLFDAWMLLANGSYWDQTAPDTERNAWTITRGAWRDRWYKLTGVNPVGVEKSND